MRRAGSRRRRVRAACAIAVVAALMQGCGHGSGDPPAMTERSDLEEVRGDAVAAAAMAAAAARTEATDAAASADGAEAATRHLATLQTGAVAKRFAIDARRHADLATAASRVAARASDDAAAAGDAQAATRAELVAAAARAEAEEAAWLAAAGAMQATEAARTELMIDGTVTSVGGTSIDVTAGSTLVHPVPGGDGAVRTGLLRPLGPMASGGAVAGVAYAAPVPDDLATAEDEARAAIPYRQAVAARSYAIGRTLDAADDTARLMLVTHYAGSQGWRVFAPPPPSAGIEVTSTKAGWLSLDPATGRTSADAAHAHNTPLTSVGLYLPAGAADGELGHTDRVAADARPVEVFAYTDPSDGTRKYATLTATVTTYGRDAGVSWIYTSGADVTAPATGGAPVRQVRVAADVPSAVAYRHLRFGVWAALGAAARDGSQSIAGPGIGFVQDIGDGPSGADLPVGGNATYAGNWVAAVRSGGRHALRYGPASLTARFGDGAVTATLAGLAVLEGRLDGSRFHGTRAAVAAGNRHGLAPGGAYAGTFDGGFYGAEGEEAGGVFDFASAGLTGGGFRGAFGGVRQE